MENWFETFRNPRLLARRAIGAAWTLLLILVCSAFVARATADITLVWDPSPEPDIAGYRVYSGPSSGNYIRTFWVGNTAAASVSDLEAGRTYFFAVTASNTTGLESTYSNEVSFAAPGSTPAPTPTPTPIPSLPNVSTPTISPRGGQHRTAIKVTLRCATRGAVIYFTIDGTRPTTTSNIYHLPFMLDSSTTVKAQALKSGYNASAITSATFGVTESGH
jgi:Chitobiase/beta-hexosaminidase C-terminal domain/Fibronectin type III domain